MQKGMEPVELRGDSVYPSNGVSQHSANIAGSQIAYVTGGSGPTVILLHGIGDSSVAWAPVVEKLLGSHTVYAIDLPGHGDSVETENSHDLQAAIDILDGLFTTLGHEQVALVGHSLGGLIALAYSLRHPDRLTHLVLVAPAGLSRDPPWLFRLASLPAGAYVLLHPAAAAGRRLMGRWSRPPLAVSRRVLDALAHARAVQVSGTLLGRIVQSGVGWTGMRDGFYLYPRLHELRMPLMVVWGEQDKLFPVKTALKIQKQHPVVRIAILPNVGHEVPLEASEQLANLVETFLSDT